jgi:DNA-binding NarL/FixJ family response regulator
MQKNLKVLIVDDVDSISIAIQMILLNMPEFNFMIRRTVNYKECIRMFDKENKTKSPFELVIMDLNLGGEKTWKHYRMLEGEKLILELKDINPNFNTIIYSQYDEPRIVKKVIKNVNPEAYIVKSPKSIIDIRNAIKSIYIDQTNYYSEAIRFFNDKPAKLDDNLKLIIKYIYQGYSVISISKKFEETAPKRGTSVRTIQRDIKKIRKLFGIGKNDDLIPSLREKGYTDFT